MTSICSLVLLHNLTRFVKIVEQLLIATCFGAFVPSNHIIASLNRWIIPELSRF